MKLQIQEFCIRGVGVDAGLIMICDESYYDKWGKKVNYEKNEYGRTCSQKIRVTPGVYKVKWSIPNTWHGDIGGEGILKTSTGIITISDPCYCIGNWDKWLRDTRMARKVGDGVILIDKMGGDGCYVVNFGMEWKNKNKEGK